jgi:flagellar hook-length control protein FliK
MTILLHALTQPQQAALETKAPAPPAGNDAAPAVAASFDAKLAQAISGQIMKPEQSSQQPQSALVALPEDPAPSTIASIMARAAPKEANTKDPGRDGGAVRASDREPKGLGVDGVDGAFQKPVAPVDQSQPQPGPSTAQMQPQTPAMAIPATMQTKASKMEAAAVDGQPSGRAGSEILPVDLRGGATQTLPVRSWLPLQNDQKPSAPVEPAAQDSRVVPTEMPVAPVPQFASILDVSINGGLEPDVAPRPLDLSSHDWMARLSNEIIAAQRNDSELAFRLTPQHLGTLEISLSETAQGMIVEMLASKEEAGQIIAREEPRLVEELRQRGVPVAELSLRNGAGDDGRNPRNGANPAPQLPLTMNGPQGHEDQDQQQASQRGRLA